MIERGRVAIPVLLFALSACDAADEAETAVDPPARVLQEDLRIGSHDDEDQALTRIGTILPFTDGEVWVAQPDDGEIRVFGADGAVRTRVGRRGEGPGEFTLPSGMGNWAGAEDTVWVSDPFLRRVSLFTRDGRFSRSFAIPQVEHEDAFVIDQPAAFTTGGSALSLAKYRSGSTGQTGIPLLRYDAVTGTVQDEIARVERTATVQIRWQGQSVASGAHPFPDAALIAYAPDGARVVIVDRTAPTDPSSAHITIVSLHPAGDTIWSRSYVYQPQVLPSAEIDSILGRRISSFQSFARLEGRLSDDEAENAYRQSVPVPSYRPPLQRALVGAEGDIWLEWASAPGEGTAWWVLDATGEPIASVRRAERLDIRAVGREHVWAVITDSLDVPYLVRYRIEDM